ncbi:AGC/PKC protein kinase [Spizellomyces punctatus DAOM BR117]|uniref:protein kinase C n=1 Tax=Spizellomyces punctatus (strain DAOM BR117) TaxID=645134 RepID=A0A0L0HMA3_SPIPD|nr:AGC/PKC protein kinase [Spizellomyces punctatus DAOM BR117]KND02050.1 AGC/PKC protein kinase [Spizellomyces punctatus DAOM BR117]|eukprot:XP_016610089.1 AGC/PKC protein kinase [Spizellomyces punctatus DAOM BR117]
MDLDGKIADLRNKIEIEKKCKEGAEHMLQQLKDPNALQQCEMNVFDSLRRLDFLNRELQKLESRKRVQSGDSGIRGLDSGDLQTEDFSHSAAEMRQKRNSDPGSYQETAFNESARPSFYGDNRTGRMSLTATMLGAILNTFGVRGRSGHSTPKSTAASSSSSLNSIAAPDSSGSGGHALTQFDYLRRDTPITSEKVKYKLQEVKFKLDVEQKVKTGTERMRQALAEDSDADPKRRLEVEEKMAEANAKVAILHKAQQRYQGLYVQEDEEKREAPLDVENTSGLAPSSSGQSVKTMRRPATGRLKIRLVAATGLPGRKSAKSETYASIRIDGVQKAQSKPSRGKWNDDFDIPIDKAQEVEIAIYEKGSSVLALLWFKLWELEEELRVRSLGPSLPRDNSAHSVAGGAHTVGLRRDSISDGQHPPAHHHQEGVEAWLEMEPGGQLLVKLNFVPESSKAKRRKDGLLRRKPVQKVFPKRGHKFVAMQFYQVMKCAVCGEFLMSAQGYQCQLCKFTCHKKCQDRVLTKCITKANEDVDEDADANGTGYNQLLKHRIPHRFESSTTGMSASWCCHCGYMLPFGKKQSLRCTECSATCHKECMHLVPNFCGLKPQLINQMKSAIDQAERVRKEKGVMRSEMERQKQQQLLQQQQQQQLQQQQLQQQQQQQPAAPSRTDSANAMLQAGDRLTIPAGPVAVANTRVDSVVGGAGPKGIGLDDFTFIAVLGKGNFGKVLLARERYSNQLYAIKVLKKEFIIENDEVESTKAEKRVFLTANAERHPFLVNLHSCFQTESRIYFVMEYVSGGDLMWHIQHQQFSEKRAKFYAAEVLLALEYFHRNNIVYRDLKLDNILLSLGGHIKIADYGLCKENMPYGATTSTFCGTPEFMAPEILLDKPYGRAVDWWAFGVLIYEMLLGQSPFRGEDEEEIFEAILEDEILYPVNMAKDAVSLLQKLLTKDPSKRLGGGRGDAEDIKRHPFFKGVDWDAMLQLKLPPPYYPKISSPEDVSNFDEEFTRESPVLTPCNSVLSAADQADFRGFSYISEWAETSRAQVLSALAGRR